jgi:ABC-type multidrug transport system permease subunit
MQAYVLSALGDFERERGVAPAGPAARARAVHIDLSTRMRFNPTLASANLFVPGLMALVLTLVSALMTAISLSREKERGTLEILLVSPLRPWQIIVGKVIPYLGLGLAIGATVLVAARAVFDVPIRGSVVLLFGEILLFTLVSLALGVLIAARTGSQRAAMLGALLATLLPTTLLSGMIFPVASMPAPLQLLTNVVPARWFIVIARGIMLKGVGLEVLWRETLVLAAMTAVLLVAAVRELPRAPRLTRRPTGPPCAPSLYLPAEGVPADLPRPLPRAPAAAGAVVQLAILANAATFEVQTARLAGGRRGPHGDVARRGRTGSSPRGASAWPSRRRRWRAPTRRCCSAAWTRCSACRATSSATSCAPAARPCSSP